VAPPLRHASAACAAATSATRGIAPQVIAANVSSAHSPASAWMSGG
jgi:hypothetical protein